jgi:phosphoribosyl 1,2-cyclic phosphodiesterase
MLRFRNLGSGSTGNATVVEAHGPRGITRLLVDCGLKPRQLSEGLTQAGLAANQIDAVFVTHEHGDHMGCAESFVRRQRKPLWMSRGTHTAVGAPDLGDMLCFARDGVALQLGDLQLMPFTVPHDASEPLQLICADGLSSLGIVTDLGHATAHVLQHLRGCHALLLECNHDATLLSGCNYPEFLKQRIAGRLGHLSNQQAAEIARAVNHPALRHVVAAHLSERNNRPALAQAALGDALGWSHEAIGVADPLRGTDWVEV